MDEETKIRCDIDLRFHEILWDTNLFTVVGGGSAVETLRKLVDAYYNSERKLKIPRILICGKNYKSTMAHAFCNSIICQKVTYIESEFLDAPINSKYVFENSPDKAVIVGNIENLTRNAVSTIWQYLAFGKCYYNTFQKNDWDIIHYDGVIILTAREKKLVPKELLKQIEIVVEVEEHQDFQIRQILEQKLKYLKIGYNEQVLNLMLNSSDKKMVI